MQTTISPVSTTQPVERTSEPREPVAQKAPVEDVRDRVTLSQESRDEEAQAQARATETEAADRNRAVAAYQAAARKAQTNGA